MITKLPFNRAKALFQANGLPFERQLKLDLPAGGGVLVRMRVRQSITD